MTTGGGGELVEVPIAGEFDLEAAEAARLAGFQLAGHKAPVFIVRSWSGEVKGYRNVVRHMDPEQPIITVGPPSGDTKLDFPRTVDAWTDLCLKRLAPIELPEDIILGGWSFGGVLALEIGRKLEAAGHRVAQIEMLDTRVPTKYRKEDRTLPHKVVHHLNQAFETDPGKRVEYLKQRVVSKAVQERRRIVELSQRTRRHDAPVPTPPDAQRRQEPSAGEMSLLQQNALWTAYLKYEPRPNSIPITVLWCEETRDHVNDASLGWSSHQRGPLVCVPVPGNHRTLFREEYAGEVGRALQNSLDAVVPGASRIGTLGTVS